MKNLPKTKIFASIIALAFFVGVIGVAEARQTHYKDGTCIISDDSRTLGKTVIIQSTGQRACMVKKVVFIDTLIRPTRTPTGGGGTGEDAKLSQMIMYFTSVYPGTAPTS